MSDKTQVVLTHVACIAVSAFVFWLVTTQLQSEPYLGNMLIGAVLWMYGKIGFAPAAAVMERLLERLTPEQVGRVLARASSRPPPMPTGANGGEPDPASPFPTSPSARPPASRR
jgi:hypothetical protein